MLWLASRFVFGYRSYRYNLIYASVHSAVPAAIVSNSIISVLSGGADGDDEAPLWNQNKHSTRSCARCGKPDKEIAWEWAHKSFQSLRYWRRLPRTKSAFTICSWNVSKFISRTALALRQTSQLHQVTLNLLFQNLNLGFTCLLV